MATLTNANTNSRRPKKIELIIKDYVNKTKYKKSDAYSWTTISEVKKFISDKNGFSKSRQRLFYKQLELIYDKMMLESLLEDEEGCELVFNLHSHLSCQESASSLIVINEELISVPEKLKRAIHKIRTAFNKGYQPVSGEDGVSGNYFLRDDFRNKVAIFKPFDEEAFAPNNPKGYVNELGSETFRDGVLSGEAATREVASYLLDSKGIHMVPQTVFVELFHPYFVDKTQVDLGQINGQFPNLDENTLKKGMKYGSLQMMMKNDGDMGDYSYSKFSVEDVQAIAAQDLRILNCDRNEGNILINIKRPLKGGTQFKLIPIDHGLSFPDNLNIADFEIVWYDWPQVKAPQFSKLKEFILNLDTKANLKMLQKNLKFRPICLRNFRIAETLLKEAVKMDFTLHDIAKIIYKPERGEGKSQQEKIVEKTEIVYQTLNNLQKGNVLKTIKKLNNLKLNTNKNLAYSIDNKTKKELSTSKSGKEDQGENGSLGVNGYKYADTEDISPLQMNKPKIQINKGIGGLLEGFSPNDEIENQNEREKFKNNLNINSLSPEDQWDNFKMIPKRGRFYSEHHNEETEIHYQKDNFLKRTKDQVNNNNNNVLKNIQDPCKVLELPDLDIKKTTSLAVGNLKPIENFNQKIFINNEFQKLEPSSNFDYEMKDNKSQEKSKTRHRISRAISNPEFNFNRMDSGSNVSNNNNMKSHTRNPKLNHGSKRENVVHSKQFFHYYECFLKQLLMKIALKKDKTRNTRERFYSEYYKQEKGKKLQRKEKNCKEKNL